jgi:hypothetical protein
MKVLLVYIIFLLSWFPLYAQQDIAVIKQNDKYGLIDNRGTILLPCTYDELSVSCSDLILCKQGDKYGFIDRTGRIQIEFEYEGAGFFYNDTTWVKKEGKVGFIDRNGKLFIDCQYEKVDFFSEGFASVKLDGKWGLIDDKGNYVLEPLYDYVHTVKNSYAILSKGGKHSLWFTQGSLIAPSWKYNYLNYLHGYPGIFVATEIEGQRRTSLVGISGGKMYVVLDEDYIHINNVPQFFNLGGKCSPELRFEYINFQDSTWQEGILNPSFNKIISGYKEIKYLSPYYFLCMKKEGYYDPLEKHVYDTTGSWVGDFSEYTEFGVYRDGKLLVCKNEKWGLIDFQKNTLLPFKYEELTPFKNGVAMARIRNKYYLIDERGKRISKALPCDKLSVVFYENLIVIQKGDKYGAIDYTGKLVLPVEYDQPITFYPMSIFVEDFK